MYPIKFTPIVKDKIWGGEKLKSTLNKKSDKDNLGESWNYRALMETFLWWLMVF